MALGASGHRALRGDHLERALHVAMHLRDELLASAETPLPAQALEEVQAQAAAVEVALEVDYERLDELGPARLEGGAHADAHGRGAAVTEARVDAMAGIQERLIGDQVRRGEAELAPALVAVHHIALKLEGRAQEMVCLAQLAGQHEPADVAGGDDLAVDLQQRVYDRLEAAVTSQQPRI